MIRPSTFAALTALAMLVDVRTSSDGREQYPERELTNADLERLEAARLKRERRAAKRRKMS